MNSAQITHLSSWGNYTRIHLADGKVDVHGFTLKTVLARPEFSGFIRIHRSIAVNPLSIQFFNWTEEKPDVFTHCFLHKVNGSFPVARRRTAEVHRLYVSFKQTARGHS